MNWIQLNSIEQLSEITQESENQQILIFKHSTTCSISATALARIERKWNQAELSDTKTYFLDLPVRWQLHTKLSMNLHKFY